MHFQGSHFQNIIAGYIAWTRDAQNSITKGKVELDFMVSSRNFMSEFQRKQGIQDGTARLSLEKELSVWRDAKRRLTQAEVFKVEG